jgi:glycosyltransferase involved in cell wall biosynthesis
VAKGGNASGVRLLAVYTHPVQYYAPLFRTLTRRHPEIDFGVLYVTRPTAEQQGQGFGVEFQWDLDVLDGYRSRVFRTPLPRDDYTHWGGVDAPGIGKAIEEARPDVVLLPGWNCRGLVRALFACNRLGIPVLYRGDTTLWQRPGGLHGFLWSMKNRVLLHRFAGFLAVGKRARIFLREHGIVEERIVDSPHAVDGARIRREAGDAMTPAGRERVRAEFGFGPEDFVVLFVGKLEPRKNPEGAIRAIAGLGAAAVLVVCGSGELEASCRELAAELGTRVVWLGFRNQSEVSQLYAVSDVLLLPSVSETWGLVVNEAMAVGTPCIVSDAVGCGPDLIEPGISGEIFPASVPLFLLEGLQRLRMLAASDGALAAAVRMKESAYSLERAADGIALLATNAVRGDWPIKRTRTCHVVAGCDGMAILGGMERRTMEILDYVADGGGKVHCIISREPPFRFRVAHRIERSGHTWSHTRVTAGFFGGERSLGWVLRLTADILSSSAKLIAACARRRPHAIFLWSFGSALKNWPALVLLRWLGLRIILRSGSAPALGARHQRIWKWLVDPVVTSHVAISDFIATEISRTGICRGKVRVVRNALPASAPGAPVASTGVPSVIYVGQIIPEKGVLEFLDALSLLVSRQIHFTATLVGRFHGWEPAAYAGHKKAVAAKIATFPSGTVTVLGEREDVLSLMQSASVHCCPSQEQLREGLGQVVLEAKAAGIPSVVTPSGALPEMIRHRVDGWVCRGFGPEAIAEGLAHFLVKPETCRLAGLEAAAWRPPAYMKETVGEQWKALLCGASGSSVS